MKRFSKGYCYYLILMFGLGAILFALIGTGMFVDNENRFLFDKYLIFLICVVVFYVFFIIYSILYYRLSGYEFGENVITCKRGVIFKRKSILEYEKIHAVNKKQNIFHRLFRITALMIDSGSTNTPMAEIVIYDDNEIIEQLYEKLKINHDISQEEITKIDEYSYNFTGKSKLLYSFLNSGLLLIFMLICLVAFISVVWVFKIKIYDADGTLITPFILTLLASIICLSICLLTIIICLLQAFIGYYNFKITKNGDYIEISYGLLNRVNNSLKISRVKAVKISQGIMQRIFHFVTMRLEMIGYLENENQDNQPATGIFIPLCTKSEIKENIKTFLPMYVPIQKEKCCKSYGTIVLWPVLLTTIIALVICFPFAISSCLLSNWKVFLYIILGVLGISLLTIGIILGCGALAYKNNGITISDDKLSVYFGSLIKQCTVVLKKDIIAIEDITTKRRRAKGIYNYKIHFHTNATSNVLYIKGLDENLRDCLLACLKF